MRSHSGCAGVATILILTFGLAAAQTPPTLLDSWGEAGPEVGQLDSPLRIDVPDPWSWVHAGSVLVVDGPIGARRVQRFTSDGLLVRAYDGVLVDPVAVTFVDDDWMAMSTGRIAVLDAGADEVRVLDMETGVLLDQWSVPAIEDGDLDFDRTNGTYWVCLTDQHVVQQYTFGGQLMRTVGTLGAPGGGVERFDSPRSVDARGQIVVADTGNDRVVEFWYSQQAVNWATGGASGSGPGQFDSPWAVTSDCSSRVLVADRGNARIQRMILTDTDPDPLVYAPALVLDEVWFDDGSTFGDLVDLVNPSLVVPVTGLSAAQAPRDVIAPGVPGLYALDRARALVARYDDDCCGGGMLDPSQFAIESAGGDLLISPAGTGPSLTDMGGTVTVTLVDPCGEPIVGFPYQDVYLDDFGDGSISLCWGGSIADANADANGRVVFSGALAAGGYTEVGLTVWVAGLSTSRSLPFRVVSPDLNGDLVVNLGDVAAFAQGYAEPYHFRNDLNFDGVISLGDVGLFAQHLGAECP